MDVITIQSYLDTLAYNTWIPWMEDFLNITPSYHQELNLAALTGKEGSDPPSRANELHRLGVLKYAISGKKSKGWQELINNHTIVNDVGYIYYYVCKAIFKNLELIKGNSQDSYKSKSDEIYIQNIKNIKLENAYLSLSTIFMLRSYIVLENGFKLTMYSAIRKLKEAFDLNNLSNEDEYISNMILTSIILSSSLDSKRNRLLDIMNNNDICQDSLPIYEQDEKQIRESVSISNVLSIIKRYNEGQFRFDGTYRQRGPNYFAGNYKPNEKYNDNPKSFERGLLYLGTRQNSKFLDEIYKNELTYLTTHKTNFLDEFFVDISSNEEVPDTFEYLNTALSNISPEVKTELSQLMKTLSEGIKEALRILGEDSFSESVEKEMTHFDGRTEQKIYYGCPGTGKSTKLESDISGKIISRVTFHPEYSYSSFIGSYKPTKRNGQIDYSFVPQVFIDIYVEACKNPNNSYALVIEEINRGNCAEIFGDLFQVLERNKYGKSRFPIALNNDLKEYLKVAGIVTNNELSLPPNLSIYATMNTSDQSLFPIDSAFKRRWDWEYVPINYHCKNSDFTIKIGENFSHPWLNFIQNLNKIIFDITYSEDKQLGNWFVRPDNTEKIISEEIFVNKVLYYLWHEVFNSQRNEYFCEIDINGNKVEFSFGDIFNDDELKKERKIISIINNINQ